MSEYGPPAVAEKRSISLEQYLPDGERTDHHSARR